MEEGGRERKEIELRCKFNGEGLNRIERLGKGNKKNLHFYL